MKIAFDETTIAAIVGRVTAATGAIIRAATAPLEEAALLEEIRTNEALNSQEKIMNYLQRTKRGTYTEPVPNEDVVWVSVESEYLRRSLGLSTIEMRKTRDALEVLGEIVVDRKSHRPITIRYVQSD
jgi:hypothetical protein